MITQASFPAWVTGRINLQVNKTRGDYGKDQFGQGQESKSLSFEHINFEMPNEDLKLLCK